MRYIPQSKYSYEEILEQCMSAIKKTEEIDFYDELCEFEEWKDELAATVW